MSEAPARESRGNAADDGRRPGGMATSRPYETSANRMQGPQSATLADILERVLDKGIIIAGDIRVNLLDIELLTIKLRLLVVSVDKAEEMGIDWWKHDPMLTVRERGLEEENQQLRERLERLEGGNGDDRRDGRAAEGDHTEGEVRSDQQEPAAQREPA